MYNSNYKQQDKLLKKYTGYSGYKKVKITVEWKFIHLLRMERHL